MACWRSSSERCGQRGWAAESYLEWASRPEWYNLRMAHVTKPSRYTAQVGARGRLVLPAAVRKQLSLNEGDRVVLTLEPDGSMRLVSLREQVERARGLYKHIAPERDLVGELLRERRQEARMEDED
jgi:AbrB family looped-hinge helix DNA binding protein